MKRFLLYSTLIIVFLSVYTLLNNKINKNHTTQKILLADARLDSVQYKKNITQQIDMITLEILSKNLPIESELQKLIHSIEILRKYGKDIDHISKKKLKAIVVYLEHIKGKTTESTQKLMSILNSSQVLKG